MKYQLSASRKQLIAERAWAMRQALTPTEEKLWRCLSGKQLISLLQLQRSLWKWMVVTTHHARPRMRAGTGTSLVQGIACCTFRQKLSLGSCHWRFGKFALHSGSSDKFRSLRAVCISLLRPGFESRFGCH